MKSRFAMAALFFAACSLLWIPVANAYVDPGTGSFIFQAALGALLAVGVAVKVFWRRVARFLTRKDRPTPDL
jgi:membrane protein implicated in regulation of membrane protease activity